MSVSIRCRTAAEHSDFSRVASDPQPPASWDLRRISLPAARRRLSLRSGARANRPKTSIHKGSSASSPASWAAFPQPLIWPRLSVRRTTARAQGRRVARGPRGRSIMSVPRAAAARTIRATCSALPRAGRPENGIARAAGPPLPAKVLLSPGSNHPDSRASRTRELGFENRNGPKKPK